MKVFLLSLFTLLSLGAVAVADSIVSISSSAGGRYLTDASGIHLADGSLVLLGSFSDADAISLLPVPELEQTAGWTLFGDTQTMTILGNEGKVSDDVRNSTPEANSFAGKQIFIWVFNAPTIAGSTQYGLYTAWGGDPAWIFAQGSPEGQATISLNNLALVALLGSVSGNEMRLVGIPVPEPAAYAAALGLAALAVAVVRRRNRAVPSAA